MLQANRDHDCLAQFKSCHLVGIVGTNRALDNSVQQGKLGHFNRLQWAKGDPSTGLELWAHRRYIAPKHFRGHWSGEGELRGRVGAARFKTPQLDLLCIVAYLPPNDTRTDLSKRICKWMCELVSQHGHRCVPLIFMDGNAHLGLDKIPGLQHTHAMSKSASVGTANPAPENTNGRLLRQFAERHHLCFGNTFFRCSPTFYSNDGRSTSRVDYLLLPQALRPQIQSCEVWDRAGDALQLIDCNARRDHRPLVLNVTIRLRYGAAEDERIVWDHDKLYRCLRGEGLPDFVHAVESRLQGVDWNSLAKQGPDAVHQALHEPIMEQALCYFRKSPADTKHNKQDTDLAAATEERRAARLALRRLRDHPQDSPEVSVAAGNCKEATKVVRRIKRRLYHARQAALVAEVAEAWRKKDFATAWKVSRILAGKNIGPKRRQMAAPATPLFDKSEWLHFLAQQGPQGGVSATLCPATDVSPNMDVQVSGAHLRMGRWSAWRTQRELRYSKLRKTPPPWSFPAAVWRMLLEPDKGTRCRQNGVRNCQVPLPSPNVSSGFLMLHASMQASRASPRCWHKTGAFTIAKRNGKTGPAGLRLLHSLESLGKAYYAQVWKRVPATYKRHYAAGYLAHRRREQAILQQSLLRHRLQQGRVSHFTAFYDLANAFACASHQRTLAPFLASTQLPSAECAHLRQRLQMAQMVLPCADGALHCSIGSGTLPGDTIAGPWFLAAYHPRLDSYLQSSKRLAVTASSPELQRGLANILAGNLAVERSESVDPPSVPMQMDVSLSSYADDVARTMRADSALCLHNAASLSSTLLSRALAPDFAQNEAKQEVLPFFAGQGANSHLRNAFTLPRIVPGSVQRHARYLGPYLAFDGQLHDERGRRVQAARTAYYALGKFWAKCRVKRWRLTVFKSMVVGAAYSGLVAFPVQAPDVRTLDKELLKFGRKVLQGTACEKSVDKYKALSNDHVWRLLRSAPTAVELSVQRLQWWQRIVARPEEHLALLFTFFGHIPGTPAPFDENGAIHDRSHAWMRQLGEDIRQLAAWDSSGFMSAAADGPLVLFVDADFREAFLQQDPAELRTRYLGGLVPPPGLSLPSAAPPGADAADETFACDALLADGQPCNATFPTYRALAVHLAHSKQHEQRRSLATLLTISNQCCACRATLASVRVARNHLHDSIRRGYCSQTAGSATVHQVHASLPCKCAICDVPLRLLGEAQAHLASHLPTAFRRPRIDYYFQRHGRPVGSAPSASA